MKTPTHVSSRGHEILAQMGQIPIIVQGKLSERHSGDKVTGQKLQRWRNGRNQTIHIPAEVYDTIKQGTQGHQEFLRLAKKYVEIKDREALQHPDNSKKKPMKQSMPGPGNSTNLSMWPKRLFRTKNSETSPG